MDPLDEERELLRLRESCLAFVSVAMRQHQDRRAGITAAGPSDTQLEDIKLLIAAGGLQHMDRTALTMVGIIAGIAGIIVTMTDAEDLLQKMILQTAQEAAELEAQDDR